MSIAIYPGSFDPITLGHIDIIKRLSPHYEKFIILVANNSQKEHLFSPSSRCQLIEESLRPLPENSTDTVSKSTSVTLEPQSLSQGMGGEFLVEPLAGVHGRVENIQIESTDELTINYAKKVKANFIIRGIRTVSDFEYEMSMANMNKSLCPYIETMVVFTNPQLDFLSSRMVKEIAYFDGPLEGLVPRHIGEALKKKMVEKNFKDL